MHLKTGISLFIAALSAAVWAEVYWTSGGTDDNWSTAANWSAAPAETDDIRFKTPYDSPSDTIVVDGKYTVARIYARASNDKTIDYVLSATGENGLNGSNSFTVGGNNGESKITLSGGVYSFSSVNVGNGAATANNNEMVLSDGASFSASGEVRIGNGTNYVGRLTISGDAELSTTRNFFVGTVANDAAHPSELIIDGGRLIINSDCLYLPELAGAYGELTLNSGLIQLRDSDTHGITFVHNKTGSAVVNLNGGTLQQARFRLDKIAAGTTVTINFNGTTLKPTRTMTTYLDANEYITCNLLEGGLVFDTDGKDVTIAHSLTGEGGIVKKGAGTLTLASSANDFTGRIVVKEGKVIDQNGIVYEPVDPDGIVLDASAGGNLGTVQLQRLKLGQWLQDSDIFSYISTYGANGTTSLETPLPVVIENGEESVTFTNLKVGETYGYEVGGKTGTFATMALAPRTLKIDTPTGTPVANVRDMGSWPLLGGKTMNQNVILRGGHLDGFQNATATQRAASYLTEIGLKTEIELRCAADDANRDWASPTSSFAADDCAYVWCGLNWGDNAGTQIGADDNGNFTNQMRRVFTALGTEGSLPAYFHCRIGTDRTGITGLLLLGLLGTDEEYLFRDYLMSNFANIGGSRDANVPETFLRYIHRGNCNGGKYVYNDNEYGKSVSARCRAYLEMCGVPTANIENIVLAMTGETLDELKTRIDTYESANGFRTVSYVPYPGSSTTNAIHRFGTTSKRILPLVDTSSWTHDGKACVGWDIENEVMLENGDAVVYAKYEEPVQEPRKFSWCNDNQTSLITDAGNWRVRGSDPHEHDMPTIIDTIDSYDGAYAAITNGTFEVKEIFMGRYSNVPATIDITNGTVSVSNILTIGRYGSSATVNVFGGNLTAKDIAVGNWGTENGTLNVYGGEVDVLGGNWPGAINIGLQTESRGDMLVAGGKVTAGNTVNIGFSNLTKYGGPSAETASTLTIESGEMAVTGDVNVGGSDGENGGGHLTVEGGTLTTSGTVNVANSRNAWGQVDVTGGEVTINGSLNIVTSSNGWGQVNLSGGQVTIVGNTRIGNHNFGQHAVLNISNCEVDCADISISRNCSSELNISHATVRQNCINKAQDAPASANVKVFVDGGTIVAKSNQGYFFSSSNEIGLGEDGMIFDTDGHDITIQAYTELKGLGGVTKKGEGTLEFVANSFGFAGTWNARGPISVEAGTLKLPSGQTIYCTATNVADGAVFDLNGSTIILVDKKVVTSRWTNAAGDGDVNNPLNWSSDVAFYDKSGAKIPELSQTLDGVVPASDTTVRIPVEGEQPTNVGALSVGEIDYVASEDLSLIKGFGATFDEYAAGTLVVASDIKIDNKLNGLLKSAVAWYDPSELATLTVSETNTIDGIANKGSLGSAMDFMPMGSLGTDKTMPVLGAADGWALNGVFFDKDVNRGFKTSTNAALAGDKTLMSIGYHIGGEWYPFLSNTSDTFGWIGPAELFGASKFRYHINGGDDWGAILNPGPGTSGKTTIHTTRVADTAVSGDIYYADENTVYSADSNGPVTNLVSDPMRLCMGERSWWNGTAQNGYVGECLAFNSALSDNAVSVVRQYLAEKWLADVTDKPFIGETSVNVLKLENSTVDFDGAPAAIGALGGSGAIVNANGVAVERIFLFDFDAEGNMPKITIDSAVEASRVDVACSEALYAAMLEPDAPKTVTLVEAPAINFGMRRHIESAVTGHKFVVYKTVETMTVDGETVKIEKLVFKRDNGFSLSIR